MKKFFKTSIYLLLGVSLLINVAVIMYAAYRFVSKRQYVSSANLVSDTNGSLLRFDSLPPSKGIDKTNILNTLAERFGYNKYLEIGQGMARDNFDHIRCRIRIGVDPDPACNAAYKMTSDDFFKQNKAGFDLIFIDGLHHSSQAYRDIMNSLNCLDSGGTIVVHDCNPETEAMQKVPRVQDIWTGDVWKAWVRLRAERDDLDMSVISNGNGCGIIRRGSQERISVPDSLTWNYFEKNRSSLLNLITVNQFLRRLKRPALKEYQKVEEAER